MEPETKPTPAPEKTPAPQNQLPAKVTQCEVCGEPAPLPNGACYICLNCGSQNGCG